MKKMSKDEMWNLSKKVAETMVKEEYPQSEIEAMDKYEMAKKFNVRIKDMPDKVSMHDGKDYDEDDCFDYFKSLLNFHIAVMKNPNNKH